MWRISFCQQMGTGKLRNQDALFNGEGVFQYKLKNAETIEIVGTAIRLGIADGVSHSPQAHIASRYFMQALAECNEFSRDWLKQMHHQFCEDVSRTYFGSSTTFVACEMVENGVCRVMNVGNSRAYKITSEGKWQQLSFDHTLLEEMKLTGNVDEQVEYSGIYNGLSDCLIADMQESDFRIFTETVLFKKNELLLLCSDGLIDDVPEQLRNSIWQRDTSVRDRLTALRKAVKRKLYYDDFSVVVCEKID